MADVKKIKVKKKRWFEIIAPKIFREVPIGESIVEEPSQLIGKFMTINLMTITNNIKTQNTNVKLVVTGLRGNVGITEIIGYQLIASTIRRLVRKGRKKVEFSFLVKTSDGKDIRIKPLLVVRISIKGSAVTALNKAIKETLTKEISKITYENLVKDIVSHKLQSSLKESLRKIYPLKVLEIKEMKLEKSEKKAEEIKQEVPKAAA